MVTCPLPAPCLQYFAKDYEKAIETYEAGLKHDPENEELKDGQTKCFMAMQVGGCYGVHMSCLVLFCQQAWGAEHCLMADGMCQLASIAAHAHTWHGRLHGMASRCKRSRQQLAPMSDPSSLHQSTPTWHRGRCARTPSS